MAVATSLIPGLDEIVRQGDPKRRAEAARGITELFLQGAANFRPHHIDLFDGDPDRSRSASPKSPRASIWPNGCP